MPLADKQLATLWADLGLKPESLDRINLNGCDPVFPSSFAVGTAAQVSMAAAALIAADIGAHRGLADQSVSVDMLDAAIECTGHFTINNKETPKFAELSGLYPCRDGWIRIHANFDHHRDAALQVCGLASGASTARSKLEAETLKRDKQPLENAILDNGGACAVVRTFEEWDKLPQAQALTQLPLVEITKLGEAEPQTIETLRDAQQPLSNIRVLDLTLSLIHI